MWPQDHAATLFRMLLCSGSMDKAQHTENMSQLSAPHQLSWCFRDIGEVSRRLLAQCHPSTTC